MHEGDHGILDDAHNEFEAKFGKDGEGHSHHHHSHEHGKKKVGVEQIVKIVSAVVVIAGIAAFLYFRFA